MSGSVHLIPRNRLARIPSSLHLAHEYCFFLHDESARILVEYEGANAHVVSVKFRNKSEAKAFKDRATKEDTIAAMRACGYEAAARRVILNQITLAMVSDCLHHIYEALRCLEKRKVIVALNLLRKPLTDNLLYLSWILGDEDEFFHAFTTSSPKGITSSFLKERRADILSKGLSQTKVSDVLTVGFVNKTLFDRTYPSGLQMLFQHAVHLVTTLHVELETTPENFNFIFKNYADDDVYDVIYYGLPHVLLYLSHVIMGLFGRIAPAEAGSAKAFEERSILGLYLVEGGENEANAIKHLTGLTRISCPSCQSGLKVTAHNAARLSLTDSYRCTKCQRVHPFPFSWTF